ncbi:MAG TPA: hypothetical protein VHE35_02375 [Kofleriaceae bacterium]|nr:hypothetical protein [Kofleriaceae bacterium]
MTKQDKITTVTVDANPTTGPAPAAAAADDVRPPRKYSKRLGRVQKVERSVSKAVHRLVRAADAGVGKWRDATDKSSRKRKDGAVKDALENFAKATSRSIRQVSRTPEDIVRIVRKAKVGKLVRRIIPI